MADDKPPPSVTRNTPFKRRHLDSKTAAASPAFKTPRFVPINDDEAERRIRRRENQLRSAVSPGCNTPRSVAKNPDGSNNRGMDTGTSSFTNAQIAEHYSVCVKLSTENKINAKNAFGLHLIDVMAEMLRKRGEMTNFQVAGCTLDASAKIYAGRVDSIYNDACKMVGGLGRSDRHGEAEEKEGEEGETGAPQKKKTRKGNTVTVIEKNIKSLDVSTFDLEFEVDPLFKKTSAEFDEGGVEGLLLNQLSTESDHCSLLFDANGKMTLTDRPAPSDSQSLIATSEPTEYFRRLQNFQDSRICQTFSNFRFNEDDDDDTTLVLPPINPDYCQPPSTEVDYSYLNSKPDDENCGNEDDSFVGEFPPPVSPNSTSIREPLRQRHDNPMGSLSDTIQVSEYSYFDPTVISAWAGPQHWKFRPTSVMKATNNKDSEQVGQEKKRQARVVFRVDFNATSKEDLFRKGRASTTMSKLLLERMTSVHNVLPHCAKTDQSVLYQLFCKTKVKIRRSRRLDNACELSDAGDLYGDSINDDVQTYEYDDDDDIRGDYNEARVSGAQFMGMLSDSNDINLIDEPMKVCQIDIDYAKQAKRIDVKRLKGIMWDTISKETSPDSSLSFSSLYSNVKALAPDFMANELSIPISFVCLLHLTNEKSLKVTGREDMLDFIIDP